MRHLGSFALSLVLGPVVWLLTGLGLANYAQGRTDFGELAGETALGVLLLLVAGLLYTVLVATWLSPLGPALVGAGYLGLALWSTADRSSFLDALPADFFGPRFAAGYPAEGTAFVLAMPLLAAALSPRRWRGRDPLRLAGYPGPAGYPLPGPPGFPPPAPSAPGYPPASPSTTGYPAPGGPAPGGPLGPPVISGPPVPEDATAVLPMRGDQATQLLDDTTRQLHRTVLANPPDLQDPDATRQF